MTARMDFNLPAVPDGFRQAVEDACNAELAVDRRIDVRVLPARRRSRFRTLSAPPPTWCHLRSRTGRIVDIVGLDQQADGGTHVASTRQVGRIQVVKVENKGKGFRRLRIQISG